MFNTLSSTKLHVPIELKAKTYATNSKSPRSNRFLGSFQQFVHRDGGTKLDTKEACLAVDEGEPLQPATRLGPEF